MYFLIKGTAAIKIFTGIAFLYLIWLLVQALDMKLISSILGHVMGVGVIALLIVFQQEIRKFFMLISNKYLSNLDFSIARIFPFIKYEDPDVKLNEIIKACINLSKENTGALITVCRESELITIIDTGEQIYGETSSRLISNIFFKNSPLHDGAVIIKKDKIVAAACILPVSEHDMRSENFGLRHRAALGITEQTDAVVIVVSEESGEISLFYDSGYQKDLSIVQLTKQLESLFLPKK